MKIRIYTKKCVPYILSFFIIYNSVFGHFMWIGTDRMVILVCSVERDRLRERERQARAAMSVQAEQAAAGGGPDTRHHHHHHHNHVHHHHANIHVSTPNLFRGGPVRVSTFSIYFPSATDETFSTTRGFVCIRVWRYWLFLWEYSANTDSFTNGIHINTSV